LGPLPEEPDYLNWCRAIVEKVTFGFENWYIIDRGIAPSLPEANKHPD